jgi:hypothetical protein
MTEAERLAIITHEQVRLVLQEAELVELAQLEAEERAEIQARRPNLSADEHEHDAHAFSVGREARRRSQTVWIDWMTGARVTAEIIPFPGRRK